MDYCGPIGLPHSRFLSWTDDDQDKAIEWMLEGRATCDGCGTRKEEWDRDMFAYVVEEWRCPGCELLEQQRTAMANEKSGTEGIKLYLIPRELATALDEAGDE